MNSTEDSKSSSGHVSWRKILAYIAGISAIVKIVFGLLIPASLPGCDDPKVRGVLTENLNDSDRPFAAVLSDPRQTSVDTETGAFGCEASVLVGEQEQVLKYQIRWTDEDSDYYQVEWTMQGWGEIAFRNGNYQVAHRAWSLLADDNDPDAQLGLGVLYSRGLGVTRDDSAAHDWFRASALNGNVYAQFELGSIFYSGRGVERDYLEARNWFEEAAAQGSADAQYWLGLMYLNDHGLEVDTIQAESWLRKAAEQDHLKAQTLLGSLYAEGRMDAPDERDAVRLLRRAAERMDRNAQNRLGEFYRDGRGVAVNHEEAVNWFRKAANQGLGVAQFNLGAMYQRGQGVERDYQTAVTLFRRAANNGHLAAADLALDGEHWLRLMTTFDRHSDDEFRRLYVGKLYSTTVPFRAAVSETIAGRSVRQLQFGIEFQSDIVCTASNKRTLAAASNWNAGDNIRVTGVIAGVDDRWRSSIELDGCVFEAL